MGVSAAASVKVECRVYITVCGQTPLTLLRQLLLSRSCCSFLSVIKACLEKVKPPPNYAKNLVCKYPKVCSVGVLVIAVDNLQGSATFTMDSEVSQGCLNVILQAAKVISLTERSGVPAVKELCRRF